MSTNTTSHRRGAAVVWPWRTAIAVAGVLFLAGGLSHPSSDNSVPVRESLIAELADPAWLVSHVLLIVAALVQLGALWLMKRDAPLRQRLGMSWPVAMVASALFVVESIPHLVASGDVAALGAGEATPIVDVYLLLGVIVYPVMGVALAWLAWMIGRAGRLQHKIVAAIGVFGSLVYGAAAPLTVLPETGDLGFLFAVGAIPRAWWLILLGVVGARVEGARKRSGSNRNGIEGSAGGRGSPESSDGGAQ